MERATVEDEATGEYVPAKILELDRDMNEIGEIEVQFNPTEYSLDKSVEDSELSFPEMDTPMSSSSAARPRRSRWTF